MFTYAKPLMLQGSDGPRRLKSVTSHGHFDQPEFVAIIVYQTSESENAG